MVMMGIMRSQSIPDYILKVDSEGFAAGPENERKREIKSKKLED